MRTFLVVAAVVGVLAGAAPAQAQWANRSLGVSAGLGHYCFTAAHRFAPSSVLAPVNYLHLVWAGILGWLVFGHIPEAWAIVGMVIVAAAGVLVALRSAFKRN